MIIIKKKEGVKKKVITDKELRDLFKAECKEHLEFLSDGLIYLEKNPADSNTLEDLFREAHSLKGAARIVGTPGIETIARRFENILGAAKRGETLLSSKIIDRLYHGLDSIQRLVYEAVTGEPSGINVEEILAEIIGESPPSTQPSPLAKISQKKDR
ncbi:MAG: Hpt domain-containing protein [Nitrospinota bacterium]